MNKIKFWLETVKGKVTFTAIISVSVTFVVMFVIFMPIILSNSNNQENSVIAYNRDSNSGTREAFETAIDFDSESQTFSSNVLTVGSNSDMINKVSSSTNTIGYVSLSSVIEKNDQGEYEQASGDYIILDYNGIDPIEEIEDNMQDYKAKRYFNVFFRVDAQYNDLIQANLYGGDSSNLWTSNGTLVDPNNQWDSFEDEYNVTQDDNYTQFVYSFMYFNWLMFSSSAYEDLLLSTSTNEGSAFDEGLSNFVFNVNQSTGVFNSIPDQMQIYMAGSTSVEESITISAEPFIEDVNLALSSNSLPTVVYQQDVFFQTLNRGSGDAFKPDSSLGALGTDHVWLGYQSRSPDEIEGDNYFHQTTDTIVSSSTTEGQYDIADNSVYATFEIDAIAFIINSSQKVTVQNQLENTSQEYRPTNIDTLGANLIYTEGFSFEQLFELGLMEGTPI